MKTGLILPHRKSYKLKTIIPFLEKHGINIMRVQDNDELAKIKDFDFFISEGMKNIDIDDLSLQSFISMENSSKPILIKEAAALRMLPEVGKNWVKFVWNSFYMDEGIHPYDPAFDRWEMLSKKYSIKVGDYKRRGDAILFNLQREYDAAINRLTFNNINYRDWCIETINTIRKISDRPIIIRKHPLEGSVETYLKENLNLKNVEFSTQDNFYDDLNKCWCMINYNSTSAVESVLHGTHTICLDPSAFAWEVSGHSITDIETDLEFDRSDWLKKIAYMQWHLDELEDPYVWNLIKSCVWK